MSHHHIRQVCEKCGTVLLQCRCIGPKIDTPKGLCENCRNPQVSQQEKSEWVFGGPACRFCGATHELCQENCHKAKDTQISEMKTRIERYLWNLGGCSTYALGYGVNEPHDSEMALPALEDVKKMAIQNQELKVEVDRLNSFYKEGVRIDEDRLKELSELKVEVERLKYSLGSIHNYDGDISAVLDKFQRDEKELKECLGNLMKYGRHGIPSGDICNAMKHSAYTCNCGYLEVYATTQRLMGEGR